MFTSGVSVQVSVTRFESDHQRKYHDADQMDAYVK